jgi:hypothetical protein
MRQLFGVTNAVLGTGDSGHGRIRIQGQSFSGPPDLTVRRAIRGVDFLLREGRRQENERERCHDGQAMIQDEFNNRLSFLVGG